MLMPLLIPLKTTCLQVIKKKKEKRNQNKTKKGRCSNQKNISFYLGGARLEAVSPIPPLGADLFLLCTPVSAKVKWWDICGRSEIKGRLTVSRLLEDMILCLFILISGY